MDEKKGIIIVDETFSDERIDKLIAAVYPAVTRSRIQKLIANGSVTINEAPAPNNHIKCSEGDVITIDFPEPEKVNIEPENLKLDVIYDDNDIIIVNKKQGMVVHPAAGHFSGTLVNGLMYQFGESLSGINGQLRPGIVHRIDKDTSGILVVCKNDHSHSFIADLLSRHDINRTYYCLCYGIFKDKEGTIDAPIGRSPIDRKKMAVNFNNGRNAITHYKVLSEYNGKYSLVECHLETGRTHQIRVHLTSINHPLVGDKTYAGDRRDFKSITGQLLHAGVLGFVHPTSNQYVEFRAPLPDYFVEACQKAAGRDDEALKTLQEYLKNTYAKCNQENYNGK